MADARWWLYLIECRNGHYYAGISNDVAARYSAHVLGKGARYTRANPPLRLIGSLAYPDRSSAARAEAQIRRLSRPDKLRFIQSDFVGADRVSAEPAEERSAGA